MVTYIRKSKKTYLHRLEESAITILEYMEGISFNDFIEDSNKMRRDAVLMQLQHLGETIRQLHDFYPGIHGLPKREAISIRNIIAHNYKKVDLKIVYETCIIDIPIIQSTVHDLLKTQ